MIIYILRAYTKVTHDDSDDGRIEIGTYYRDIDFSTNKEELNKKAERLNKGFIGQYWTEEESNELRNLDSHYDDLNRDEITTYRVDEITITF